MVKRDNDRDNVIDCEMVEVTMRGLYRFKLQEHSFLRWNSHFLFSLSSHRVR